MAKQNETGNAANIGNFKLLIGKCASIGNYNPSNAALTMAALATQLSGVEASTTLLHTLNGVKIAAVNDRHTKFDRQDLYATRILGAIISSGIDDPKFLADAKTILRK